MVPDFVGASSNQQSAISKQRSASSDRQAAIGKRNPGTRNPGTSLATSARIAAVCA